MSNPDRNRFTQGLERLLSMFPRSPRAISMFIVTPDPVRAEQLASILHPMGLVRSMPSPADAVQASEIYYPDVLIYDNDESGAQRTQNIAQLHAAPAMRHCLILILSARASAQDKISAFEAGADDYLVKPVSPDQLRLHVERLSRFRQVLRPMEGL